MSIRTNLIAGMKAHLWTSLGVTYFDDADSIYANDFENKKFPMQIGKALVSCYGTPFISAIVSGAATETYTINVSAHLLKRNKEGTGLSDHVNAFRDALCADFNVLRDDLWTAMLSTTGILSTKFNSVSISEIETIYAEDAMSAIVNFSVYVNLTRSR